MPLDPQAKVVLDMLNAAPPMDLDTLPAALRPGVRDLFTDEFLEQAKNAVIVADGPTGALCAKAIAEQTLPPTVNFTAPAEGCALNLVAEPRKLKIKNLLVGAHCIGGQSGACVLQAVEVDA